MADDQSISVPMMTCGAFFGAAHAWAKDGIDQFIADRVKVSMETGELAEVGIETAEQYEHAFLREAIYLLHAMLRSLPHDTKAGIDALRMASQQQQAGAPGLPPVIPTFRALICDLLGVPNPFEMKHEPRPADQGGSSPPQLPPSNPEQQGDGS